MARGSRRCTRLGMRQRRSIPRSCTVAETRRPLSLRAQRRSRQISDSSISNLKFKISDFKSQISNLKSQISDFGFQASGSGLESSRLPLAFADASANLLAEANRPQLRVPGSDPTSSRFQVPSSAFPFPGFGFTVPDSVFFFPATGYRLPATGYRLLATDHQERTSANEIA